MKIVFPQMKIRILLLVVYLMSGQASNAQKICDLQLNIVTPVNNEEIASGDTTTLTYSIKNLGPDDVSEQDTLHIEIEGLPFLSRIYEDIAVGDSVVFPSLTAWNDDDSDMTFNVCLLLRADLNNSIQDSVHINDTSCVNFIVKGHGTGISELQNDHPNNLALYPNPATNEVMLLLNMNKPRGQISVMVKDCLGRTCLQRQYGRSELSITNIKLDISSLNSGIYFVELNEEGKKSIGKLMVR